MSILGIDSPGIEARFWSKVQRTPDSCWLWLGGGQPYGHFATDARRATRAQAEAHRVSYALAVGAIPEGQHVLHRCDTPRCVRPSHLFLGTQGDNMRDMAAKGRHWLQNRPDLAPKHGVGARGQKNAKAKLTDAQVVEIRRKREAGETGPRIARDIGISHVMVYRICANKNWSHVPCPS